jgi:arylsulfatase A-like enzyme
MKKILEDIPSAQQRKYVKRRMLNSDLESREQIISKYNDSIRSIDSEVGRLQKFLKSTRLWDNTIFIIASDHGFSLDEHGIYLNHTGLYDESIHIPLIVHFPGIGGKEVSGLLQNIDLFPTILDFLGEKKVSGIDGKSMLDLIRKGEGARDHVYSFDANCPKRWSVRNKKRKIIFGEDIGCFACKGSHGEAIEEYDLVNDVGELKNVYSGDGQMKSWDLGFKINNRF